jgi:hypothetical protein
MLWLILIFLGVPLAVGLIAQAQKRRHPPLDPVRAADDFPASDNPDSPIGTFGGHGGM